MVEFFAAMLGASAAAVLLHSKDVSYQLCFEMGGHACSWISPVKLTCLLPMIVSTGSDICALAPSGWEGGGSPCPVDESSSASES